MHVVNLIASSIKETEKEQLPCEPQKGICAITGQETLCIPRKEVFGKNFTNGDLFSCPQSNMISVDAYHALKYKWERYSSWFCDGKTFYKLDRLGVREKVFEPNMPDVWAAYATTSYKKHGALNAKVNTNKNRVWLFEMRQVNLTNMEIVIDWWTNLNDFLRAGFGRSIIETLECPAFVMGKVGMKKWLEFEKWARPKYLSSLYAFLTYLLPSQEELKNEYI